MAGRDLKPQPFGDERHRLGEAGVGSPVPVHVRRKLLASVSRTCNSSLLPHQRSGNEVANMRDPSELGVLQPSDLAMQGFTPTYRASEANRCPGCGMSQWLVGRITAQCAFCDTVLPLEQSGRVGRPSSPNFWKHDMMRSGHFDGYTHATQWDTQAIWKVGQSALER